MLLERSNKKNFRISSNMVVIKSYLSNNYENMKDENEKMKIEISQVKFFIGCLPHILLGPLLNTLTHISNILQNDNFVFDF